MCITIFCNKLKKSSDIKYDPTRIHKTQDIKDHMQISQLFGSEVVVIARTIELDNEGPSTVKIFPKNQMKIFTCGAGKMKAELRDDYIDIKDEETGKIMSFNKEKAICIDIDLLEETEKLRDAIKRRKHALYKRDYRKQKKLREV